LSLEWLYGFDELNSYRLDTKKGKERLEAQTSHRTSPDHTSAQAIQ
jgi:hypothetical protein